MRAHPAGRVTGAPGRARRGSNMIESTDEIKSMSRAELDSGELLDVATVGR